MGPSVCRLKLRMEDDSVPEVTGYYNNLAVTCINALGQSVTMGCKPEGTRVVCEPLEPHRCEAVTTYKASVCSNHCSYKANVCSNCCLCKASACSNYCLCKASARSNYCSCKARSYCPPCESWRRVSVSNTERAASKTAGLWLYFANT